MMNAINFPGLKVLLLWCEPEGHDPSKKLRQHHYTGPVLENVTRNMQLKQ